ncbi:MAG: ABC transporter ATP-binding protein [Bacillota bacterium]|nr:ABC transporter ATP-binding protein [Bacillota bacterium]
MADKQFGKRSGKGRPAGPAGRMMPGEKAKNFSQTMKKLAGYLAEYKFRLVVVFIFAVASTVFNVVSPTILGNATDVVVSGLMGGGMNYDKLLNILLLLLAMYVASLVFGVIQGWIMANVSQSIIYTLRKQMSEKLDKLPLKYYDKSTHGEIQSRMINDIETVNQSLSVSMTQIITSVTTLVGILIMMFRISVIMTCTAVLAVPLSMLIIKLVVSKSQGHFRNQQKYLGNINGHVEEIYTGHDIIKAFNREEESEKTFDEYNKGLYDSAWKSQFLSSMMMPLTGFIGNLSYLCVCLLGGYLAIKGSVSIGNIQSFIQYVRNFNQPIQQVANVANQLQSTAAAAERIFELIDEEEEKDACAEAETKDDYANENVEGRVSFEHVSFGYNEGEPVIKDFNFVAEPGQTIAIVGPTGAGKTTVVKLMMRFYELNGGRICVDGKDITSMSRPQLRNMFGMVLQDTWLNSGTIRENIRYGRGDATDEEVEAAAVAAHIDHFIRTQPQGYDMQVNEEATNISQGQKQLLTIARAILSDAPIMILDEATSSVDTRTEVLIQKAMDNLTYGRTSFVIAHRLSTIQNADHILVMSHGDIVEQGNHEELLAKSGFYAELYNSQFAE